MSVWAQFRMDASRHVSRSAGQSAVAAAAYRSGEKLYDAQTGEMHDYTRRHGVVATGIESEPVRRALVELGVPLGQGYLLGRPKDLVDA